MADPAGSRTPRWLHGRIGYLTLGLGTIALGLAVHWGGTALGPAMRDILGDVLWGAMMAWWVAAIAPNARLLVRAAVALGLCFAVELSQLYHTPALDAVRATTLGHLVLGNGFDLRDLGSYTAGVIAAALLMTMRRPAILGEP